MKKAILFFLIPAVFAIIGIIVINQSKYGEVEFKPEAFGPGTGYQLRPAEYTVTASPAYKWRNGTSSKTKIVVGFILFAAGGFYVYWQDKEVKRGTWVILAICWLVGLGFIFGTHVFKYYELRTYQRTLSVQQYEQIKDNPDKIFEE